MKQLVNENPSEIVLTPQQARVEDNQPLADKGSRMNRHPGCGRSTKIRVQFAAMSPERRKKTDADRRAIEERHAALDKGGGPAKRRRIPISARVPAHRNPHPSRR